MFFLVEGRFGCFRAGGQKVVDHDFPNKTACEWPERTSAFAALIHSQQVLKSCQLSCDEP